MRMARLPVARRIADGVHLIEDRGQMWLLDMWTGQRALLADAQGVSMMRAQIMERVLVAHRLAQTVERVGIATRDGRVVDALPAIGEDRNA